MTTIRSLVQCFIVLWVAVTLSGCGVVTSLFGGGVVFGGTRQVEFILASDLNDDTPVTVDLIVVYTEALDEEIGALEASEWFEKRDQYQRDFSQDLDLFRWEWIPGQPATRRPFRYRNGARSAIIFVDYASPGAHRERVAPPNRHLRLNLRPVGFTVDPS